MTDGPLIVQSDKTLLLEVDHQLADEARREIAPFAELERAPEHIHTYRLTPLGLWNARAAGHDAEQVVDTLLRYAASRCPTPCSSTSRRRWPGTAGCSCSNHPDPRAGAAARRPRRARGGAAQPQGAAPGRRPARRRHGRGAPQRTGPPQAGAAGSAGRRRTWPATSTVRPTRSSSTSRTGRCARTSRQAAEGFWHGGSGVVVLPCGAGKTLVGAAAMALAKATTLILVTNTVAARQWRDELLRRTSLTDDEIGEYSGARKEIRPVTIATYQVLTTKRKGVYAHLELFDARDWGLIIYDEVHLLPAPVFRFTADIQARRRLGLTATLVREDGREGDVFSPHRAQALRRALEGDRGPGLDRAGRLRRGAGHAARHRTDGVRGGRAGRALPHGGARTRRSAGSCAARRPPRRRADAGHRAVPRPAATRSASSSARR